MNFNDKRKESFSGYNLNLFLSFSSSQNNLKYQNEFHPTHISKPSVTCSLFFFMQIWSLTAETFSLYHLATIPAFLVFQNDSRLKNLPSYMLLFCILTSPLNSSSSGELLLLFELIYHYFISKSLILYLLSLLSRKILHQSFYSNLPESLLCLVFFILTTKDLKLFWAIKSIYRDMTEDLQNSSKDINAGYFVLDQFGSIIEKNFTARQLEESLDKAGTAHISQLFSEEICDSCFSLIKIAKKGIESEQEVLFLKNSEAKCAKFSSISIRILPLSIHSKNLFLLIFRDISSHVAERKILFECSKENQESFQNIEKKFLNLYLLQKPLDESDLNCFRDYLFSQFETKTLINILLGSSDLKLCDFDVKTEVVNSIQMIWSKLSLNDSKINLMIDKDIPSVRSDKYKHNLLLKLMMEFIDFYLEPAAHLLITVTRTSLLRIQYKFKFFSSKLSEKTMNSMFNKKWLKSAKISTDKGKMKKIICMCSHLIKILNGQIEENKYNKELKVFKITYSLSFSRGSLEQVKNLCFLNYPEDSVIISWPLSILPKRTNLSLNKLRKLIHSKSTVPLIDSGITSTISYEMLECDSSSKPRLSKCLVFISEKLSQSFIQKVSQVADVVVGDFFFCHLHEFFAAFVKEGEVGAISTCNVFQVGENMIHPEKITEYEIRQLLLAFLER